MENKNIIIILVVAIIVLAAIVGVMFLHPTNAKEPTKIKITSNKTLTEGDNLSIKLTDSNSTAISNETVKITIVDKKGKAVVNETVKTNSKGKAKLDLDLKKGKYNVTVTYGGNDNFTGSNATQKLIIKEKVVQAEITSTSSTTSNDDSNYYNGYSRSSFSEGQQAAIDDARAHGYDSPAAYHEATGKTAGQAYLDSHPGGLV